MSHHVTRKLLKAATKVQAVFAEAHDLALRKRLTFIAQRSALLRDELSAHNAALVAAQEVATDECAKRIQIAGARHAAEQAAARSWLRDSILQASSGHAVITDTIKSELEEASAEAEAHRNEILKLGQ